MFLIKGITALIFLVDSKKKSYFFLALLFIIIYSYPILSIDYYNYQKSLSLGQIYRWEPLFVFIGEISIIVNKVNSVNVFFALTAILSLITLKKTLTLVENNLDKLLFIILVIIFPKGFFWMFYLPRQYLAVFLTFLAVIYFDNNNNKLFILTAILASLTHISSVPFILTFFLIKKITLKHLINAWYYYVLLFILFFISYDFILDFVLKNTLPRLNMVSFLDKSGQSYVIFLIAFSVINFILIRNEKSFFFFIWLIVCLIGSNYLGGFAIRFSYFIIPFLIYDITKLINKVNFRSKVLELSFKFFCILLILLTNKFIEY